MEIQTLINDAMKITGLKTEKEVIELSFKTLINIKKQEQIKEFKGKLKWEGN